MKALKLAFLASTAVILSACSATPEQCDPNVELSILGKIACSSSGSYDKRVQDKEAELATEQSRQQDLQIANQKAKNAQDKSAKQLNAKKAELKRLNSSLENTTKQLKEKAQGNNDVLSQINDVEKQIKQVNGSDVSDATKQAELEKLQRKLATYQKALRK